MQAKDYASFARQAGEIALAVKPTDTNPAFENCQLAVFYLRSAAVALGKAESLMARIENNTEKEAEKAGEE